MTEMHAKNKHNWKPWLWLIPLFVLVLLIGFAYYLGTATFQGITHLSDHEKTRIDAENAYLKEIGFDQKAFEAAYAHETVVLDVNGPAVHQVTADYFILDADRNRDTVVMAHGMGGNRQTVYPNAEMFLKMGFNVLAYDQRNSGENTADTNTFGYWESRDLAAFAHYAKEQTDGSKLIGVWGISFGATTVGVYLGSAEANQLADFAVMESPFADSRELTVLFMSQMDFGGIPVQWLLNLGELFLKYKLGFTFEDVYVPAAAAKAGMPVLVILSKGDTVIPKAMTDPIVAAVPAENRLVFEVDDSEHTEIYSQHQAEYEEAIRNVIAKARERKTGD